MFLGANERNNRLPCRKAEEQEKQMQFYSSMTTIQRNTPSFAEKRQEPLYLSAVAVMDWIPMPFKYSGISSKSKDRRQELSQLTTKRSA